MKTKTINIVLLIIVLLAAALFVAKFAGPALLKLYVESGLGTSRNMPLVCIAPGQEVIKVSVNKEYLSELTPHKLPGVQISVPKKFTVIKERVQKVYYKRRQQKQSGMGAMIYLLYEKPGFFVGLFPQVKKQVANDYEFLSRTMHAKMESIQNITDTFFVIMKTIFTPGMGDQKNLKIVTFSGGFGKGFIIFNLTPQENYFDCNIINAHNEFIKVYIKDEGSTLDLDKVLTIISTIKKI